MSLSEQTKFLAAIVAGTVGLVFLVSRLQGTAEEAVKRGLVDKPETVGKPVTSATVLDEPSEDDTYDFIIVGGGKLSYLIIHGKLHTNSLNRHRGISPCVTSFGALRLQSAVA